MKLIFRTIEELNVDDLELTELTSLDLSDTELNQQKIDILLPFIARLIKLETLKIKNTTIDDCNSQSMLATLESLPFLTSLDISENFLSANAIKDFDVLRTTKIYSENQYT